MNHINFLTSSAPSRRHLRRAVLGVAGLAAVFAGCSSDEAAEGPIDITAVDYAFRDVPERVAAGSTVSLTNQSEVEVHEVVAVRLPDDETRSVEELVGLPPDELAAFFPLVETVLVAAPNASGVVVEGDGTLAEPGRYALLCVIPTGADPAEYLEAAAAADGAPPEVEGGAPHIAAGMFAELVVE